MKLQWKMETSLNKVNTKSKNTILYFYYFAIFIFYCTIIVLALVLISENDYEVIEITTENAYEPEQK